MDNELIKIKNNNIIESNESENNTFIFLKKDSTEILKLCGNGDILVKGKLVENDKEVVDAMREFLKSFSFL